jgi:DNA-binding MarR family transcriptional regulator
MRLSGCPWNRRLVAMIRPVCRAARAARACNSGNPMASTFASPTIVLNRLAVPLHLGEVLWDTPAQTGLDGIGTRLYSSPMNQFDTLQATPSRDGAPAETGATLFSFLDVTEKLYERIAQALARAGLSYAKYELLKHLRDANGSVSLGVLAEAQQCARSNITQLIDRLESERLVRRVDDPDDRRGVRAELTPEGATLADEGTTQIDVVRAQFAACFTAAERAELARLLTKVA